jgi:hypothetical protein
MNFPITREKLQNYIKNEAVFVERKQRLEKVIQTICKEVEQNVLRNNDTKYIYRITNDIQGSLRASNSSGNRMPQPTSILEDVLDTLKKLFLDCIIQVDPLKTYIIIDWS